MHELRPKELAFLQPVDPYVNMDLPAVNQRLPANAGGQEGGESRRVYGDTSLFEVVENRESVFEFVPPGEALEVSVDDVWVLGVEMEGGRESVSLLERFGLFVGGGS